MYLHFNWDRVSISTYFKTSELFWEDTAISVSNIFLFIFLLLLGACHQEIFLPVQFLHKHWLYRHPIAVNFAPFSKPEKQYCSASISLVLKNKSFFIISQFNIPVILMLIFVCKCVAFTVSDLKFYETQKWQNVGCTGSKTAIPVPLVHWALTRWTISCGKFSSYL